jgi:aspartyl/asparaginyl beta-hydroxylase (cupin superfamily)
MRQAELAMRRRDPTAALALLTEVATDGGPPLWVQMARAHRALGNLAAEEEAIDRALALDSRDIPALIMKGDRLADRGRERDAMTFYQAAIRAGKAAADLPPGMASELWRAEGAEMKLQQKFADHLYRRLEQAGFGEDRRRQELGDAIEILLGQRRIRHDSDAQYVQEPTSFFYPGLPQRQFYERGEFDWVQSIEAGTEEVRAELQAVLADDGAFDPYVVQHPDQPTNHHVLMNDPSWSAYFLMKDGMPVPGHAERCPRTMEILRQAPVPHISGRAPNMLFSLLKGGAHIPAHSGIVNTQLICHLPLIVPPDCSLRVGSEIRDWQEGRMLIFDDSIEHEAWNRSDQTRVVLLFDIWRPEIEAAEREALTALFEAVEEYGASTAPA